MFWNRFVELCNGAGKSPNRVATELGFSSSVCTVWKKGATPRDTAIQKLADYFHVTTDYLLGNVNQPFLFKNEKGLLDIDLYVATETEKPTPVSEDGLDKQDKHLTEEPETAKKFLPERLREAMGPMNCDEFAQKFDGNAKIISLYLSGQRRPDKVTLHLMAIYLGVNPDWLYGLDAPKYKKSILSGEDGLNPGLVALIKRIPDDRMPEVERYLRFQAEQGEKP